MKYLKMIGLAAVAAAALTALLGAGSASATVLCTETPAAGKDCAPAKVEPVGTILDASVETSALLKTGETTIATCTSGTVKGSITNAGSTTTTVQGTITDLTWGGCTTTVDTLAKGTLELHHEAGTDHGTVTSSGAQVTIQFLGVSCIFKTNNTQIGTLTGSATMATFDIAATIPQSGGGFLCPANGNWSGAYTVTEPAGALFVAAG